MMIWYYNYRTTRSSLKFLLGFWSGKWSNFWGLRSKEFNSALFFVCFLNKICWTQNPNQQKVVLQKAGTKLHSSLQEYTFKHTQKHGQVTQLFKNLCCLLDSFGNNNTRGNLVENNAFCSFFPLIPSAKRTGAAALLGAAAKLGSAEIAKGPTEPSVRKWLSGRKPSKIWMWVILKDKKVKKTYAGVPCGETCGFKCMP